MTRGGSLYPSVFIRGLLQWRSVSKLSKAFNIVRYNGLGYCAFRVRYALRKRLGLLERRCPLRSWEQLYEQYDVENIAKQNRSSRFFFDPSQVSGLNADYVQGVCQQADEILHNRFRFFFDETFDLGDGPDWLTNPKLRTHAKAEGHWSRMGMFDPNVGDVKWIWESSRFAWAYTLVRAYAATGAEKYAEKFWGLFESWCQQNPPNLGPNYACGQECAIRLMAMCFALYGLESSATSTVERRGKLTAAILMHADRIDHNIDYAISTRTNHSLTEAVGLYTAGTLFPEHPQSQRWQRRGKAIFIREALKQIYPDGSYIQHSTNYHRLALQDILWAIRLGQLNDDPFPEKFLARFKLATDYLYQLQDPSGQVPNYGSNDGALIVPLNNCDYRDFRPVIQACRYALTGEKLFQAGPWDEDIAWLFGPEAVRQKPTCEKRVSSAFNSGGYYTLGQKDSWAMIRCHAYRDRPGQADMLHVDLWHKGVNLLCDSGTYSYNDPAELYKYFKSSAAHNCIVIDGIEQMTTATRFQWFDWVKAKTLVHDASGQLKIFVGKMPYRKLATHYRTLCAAGAEAWIIIDDIVGNGEHEVQSHWHIPGAAEVSLSDNVADIQLGGMAYQLRMSNDKQASVELFKGAEKKQPAWNSLYYGRMESAWTIRTTRRSQLPLRNVVVVAPQTATAKVSQSLVEVQPVDEEKIVIQLPQIGQLCQAVQDIPKTVTVHTKKNHGQV